MIECRWHFQACESMEKPENCSPHEWGLHLSKLFEHRLVMLLSQAEADALARAEATDVLYDQLRSFMALKSRLKSLEPESDTLRPAHEALLNFVSRLFMAAHQALLNNIQEEERGPSPKNSRKYQPSAVVPSTLVPSKRFLLEWQLVRLKAAKERLILELADLSERDKDTFKQLGLPESIGAEAESARLRISSIWSELPTAGGSAPAAEVGNHTLA